MYTIGHIKKALKDGGTELSDEARMKIFVKQLVERSALLADSFSWEKLMDEDSEEVDSMEYRIEMIEDILSKMKEILSYQK